MKFAKMVEWIMLAMLLAVFWTLNEALRRAGR